MPRRSTRVAARGTALAAATSAPGLGSPLPHLFRDRAHPCHICAESALAAATSAPGLRSRAVCAQSWLDVHANPLLVSRDPLSLKSRIITVGRSPPGPRTGIGAARPADESGGGAEGLPHSATNSRPLIADERRRMLSQHPPAFLPP